MKLLAPKLKWKKGNTDVHRVLNNWTLTHPSFEKHILPHEIFEKFFTTKEMEKIRLESNKYPRYKSNRSFMMTIKMLKSFIAILVLSGYNQLPRQEMYWQREDNQNRMVTALMIRRKLEESKQFLHLANNESLGKTERFVKIRPLFDALNKQCMAHYKPEQHLSIDKSMVPYFGKHGAKQLYRIYGNQLSLAISCGYRQSRWDAVLNSVRPKRHLQYSKDMPQVLFPGPRSQPYEHVCSSATNHWIVKGTHDDVPNQDAQNLPVFLQKLQFLSSS